MYLGFSSEHSTSVGLILNLTTGSTSPQFHVVFDNLFSTVPSLQGGPTIEGKSFDPAVWEKLIANGLCRSEFQQVDAHGQPLARHTLADD